MSDIIKVVALLSTAEGKGDQLVSYWKDLSGKVRAEEGCLAYDLHAVRGKPERFVVLERSSCIDALRAHGKTLHMAAFAEAGGAFLSGAAEVLVLLDDAVA